MLRQSYYILAAAEVRYPQRWRCLLYLRDLGIGILGGRDIADHPYLRLNLQIIVSDRFQYIESVLFFASLVCVFIGWVDSYHSLARNHFQRSIMKIEGIFLALSLISVFLCEVESFHHTYRSKSLSRGQIAIPLRSLNLRSGSQRRPNLGLKENGRMYMHLGHSHSHRHHHDHEEHDHDDFLTHDVNRNMPQDGPSSGT